MTRHILLVGVFFLLITSCANQRSEVDPITPSDGDDYLLELSLSIRNATEEERAFMRADDTGAVLRGMGAESGDQYKDLYDPNILNENKIDHLNVFIFATDGSLIKAYKDGEVTRSNTSSTIDGSYKGTLKVVKDDVRKIENQPVKIIAVANAKDDIITGVKKLSELQDKFETYTDLNAEEKARTNFLMDAMLEVSNIKWDAEKSFKVSSPMKLRRALAKIRLRIDKIDVTDFQNGKETPYEVVNTTEGKPDVSVKLIRYSNVSSLLAGKSYTPQWQAETKYRLMPKRQYTASGLGDRAGEFYGSFPFYAGESTWIDPTTKQLNLRDETYLMVRIKLRPKTPKAGDNGTYYYYRLPINYRKKMDGIDEERLHKVERNYLYDVLTSIGQLGSLDEGTPVEVKSHIALQPWPESDNIDGTIIQAHYLVVKEHKPVMANVSEYKVEYISSLPVKTEITEVFYEYYDQRGDYYKVVFSPTANTYEFWWYGLSGDGTTLKKMFEHEIRQQGLTRPKPTGKADGTTVVPSNSYIKDGIITVKHAVPVNFVPFQIKFKVTQIDNGNPNPLSDSVFVTQYPPLFVTGRRSPGFAGGTSQLNDQNGQIIYADFRHYSSLGSPNTYQGSSVSEAQRNDVFNRITTKVPSKLTLPGTGKVVEYCIGYPVDDRGLTKTDPVSNKIVSPEFIIATQHGMVVPNLKQTGTLNVYSSKERTNYVELKGKGYGPYSVYFPKRVPNGFPAGTEFVYSSQSINGGEHDRFKAYSNATERCYNYFEGEYGHDGYYEERYYTDNNRNWRRDKLQKVLKSRVVYKTFKYKGRWRVPTVAEVQLIDAIQDNPYSVTKRLMFGKTYWTAETGYLYDFINDKKDKGWRASVRCIFDTYMYDDDKGLK